jgi:integrase
LSYELLTTKTMSISFKLRTAKKEGEAYLTARIQAEKLGVNLLVKTPIKVNIAKYTASPGGKLYKAYMASEEGLSIKQHTINIEKAISSALESGIILDSAKAKQIIDDVFYKDEREAQEQREQEERELKERANKMTLSKYIDLYIEQVKSGARQTDRGRNYAASTIRSIVTAMNQWKAFQKSVGRTYDFEDIDMKCYYDYTTFLKNKVKVVDGKQVFDGYSINSVGKCVKELKAILYTAETEGYHSNNLWKDRKFKGTRVEVDNVYLTRDELQRMMDLKYDSIHKGHEIARDIFMVGCWTAQRVSDYNNISKDSIHTYTKRWIEDVPDEASPGRAKPEIREKEITYIDIKQKKTGAKVAIPCSSQLLEILRKYDFQMPHLEDQVINRYLKEICKDAGIDELVEIEVTNGGTPKKVWKPKYDLVHTHTARRTGATLMYLSGMDVYDIMKITGHTSPAMLRKYIKAEQLQVVEKITEKYDYFN